MRRVQLNQLTENMTLAKSIYHDGNLILAKGMDKLKDYVDKLEKFGIFSVYVKDDVSVDIEVSDAIHYETREKCKRILNNCFNTIKNQGNLSNNIIDEMVISILSDLFEKEDVIVSMADIGVKDDATLIHSVNTAVFSVLTGRRMNLSEIELKNLAEGALLHDIGKVLISSNILLKDGKLSDDEFANIKEHSLLGYEILLERTNMSEEARKIALQHHERLDGSGYPYGLYGDQISKLARIVAVSDVYDALTAERCYRKSMSNFKAYSIIKQDVGIKYDEEVFKKFMLNIAVYPNGVVVHLSDGTHGIVSRQNKGMPFRPVVRVIDDKDKEDIKLYDLNLLDDYGIYILD